MIRLCLCIILLNSFNYDVKLTSVCMGSNGIRSTSTVNNFLRKFLKLQGQVRTVISRTTVKSDHIFESPPRFTDFLLNNSSSYPELEGSEDIKYPSIVNIESEQATPTNMLGNNVATEKRSTWPVKTEMNASELIASLGFRYETHTITTFDGYILTMQRILPNTLDPPNHAVILHHGLLGSSEDWLLLGRRFSLPYLLTDKGYDVWLLNARGNKYSRKHNTRNINSNDYWNFSWHEMGVYDLPASITYISKYSHDVDLHFVGHSMGASALLTLLSSLPEYNNMLKSAFLLAPLAFMHHAKGPIHYLADIYESEGINALDFLGTSEFMPNGVFPEYVVEKFCKGRKMSCFNPLLLITNGGEILNKDLMPNILDHVPAGGSAKTVLHYLQLVRKRKFQMYDYGLKDNMKRYKRKFPPRYNLGSVSLSISVFTSPSDWLSSSSDVKILLHKLKNINIHHTVTRDNFGHMDFVWAKDAPELVFSLLLDILNQIAPVQGVETVPEEATSHVTLFTEGELLVGNAEADTFVLSTDV